MRPLYHNLYHIMNIDCTYTPLKTIILDQRTIVLHFQLFSNVCSVFITAKKQRHNSPKSNAVLKLFSITPCTANQGCWVSNTTASLFGVTSQQKSHSREWPHRNAPNKQKKRCQAGASIWPKQAVRRAVKCRWMGRQMLERQSCLCCKHNGRVMNRSVKHTAPAFVSCLWPARSRLAPVF